MTEVYKRLVQELSAGRPAVLAAIIRQAGSSPRSLGTKFVVCQDGSLEGSIGGGSLEARVIKAAEGLLGRDAALVMEIPMTGKDVAGTEMICGGNVDVIVHAISPANAEARKIFDEVLRLMEKGKQGILAVGPLPDRGQETEVSMLLYGPEAEVLGSILDNKDVIELIRSHAESILRTNAAHVISDGLGGRPVLLEPLFSQPTLIIFGGGHISVKLAPLLTAVDFRVVVVDDRAEFANKERFPQAAEIIVNDYVKCFDQLEFNTETYCVIVTRGHIHDKAVLENVLARPTRYMGMIGSRRKRNMVYESLMKQGVEHERLKKVHAPIGLEIGAETPEEIAISIAAELVQVRAQGLNCYKGMKV